MTTETKATHTPGPWAIERDAGYPPRIYGPEHGIMNDYVAELEPRSEEGEQTANARLVAAAPDLLAALEYQQRHSKGRADHSYQTFVHMRDDAIAMARGE